MSESYKIPLAGLKAGRHTFDCEIGDAFFEEFEESEIKQGTLNANVLMEKRTGLIDLTIEITGSVIICCDRCLEMFSHPVDCENRLIVKYGQVSEEDDPDILTVPAEDSQLDLMQNFYEYIFLDLPIRRVHPDDKEGNSTCDPEMLRKLKEHIVEEEKHDDPRWDELKKLLSDN